VEAVPTSEAQVTGTVISTAITNYLHEVVVGEAPGIPRGVIYEQAHASVPAVSKPGVEEHLPRAFGDINYMYSQRPFEGWSRDYAATAVARAVVMVSKHVAGLSDWGIGYGVAQTWSDASRRMATDVYKAFTHTGPNNNQDPPRPAISDRPSAARGTTPGGCEAVLQTARLHAALYAIRDQASTLGHVRAVDALAAVAAGGHVLPGDSQRPYLTASCTCCENRGICDAVLQSDKLRAALDGLWSYNTMVGNHEAVEALAAVATAAGLPTPPEYRSHGLNRVQFGTRSM
jgi:hypothetical protein